MLMINDMSRNDASMQAALVSAATRVLNSSWFVLGKENSAFEQEFAEYLDSGHVIGVGNGTDALQLAMSALGVGRGDRVAIVANAGFYSSTALLAIGGVPVYIDVDAQTRLMDPAALDRALSANPEVKSVIITHLFGLLADMDALLEICRCHKVRVIEDCAQAHGARRNGRLAGTFGDIGTFSFYPTKNLGAAGDGGAVCTDDDALADKLKSLRQYGWKSKYEVALAAGCNSRLDEIQAAILREKLKHLDAWNARRREIATAYSEKIDHAAIQLPPVYGKDFAAHLYVLECDDRTSLAAHLKANGIASDIHYPIPDHLQPVWNGRMAAQSLPVTERLAGRILTLPCFPQLTDAEIEQVTDAVNSWRV